MWRKNVRFGKALHFNLAHLSVSVRVCVRVSQRKLKGPYFVPQQSVVQAWVCLGYAGVAALSSFPRLPELALFPSFENRIGIGDNKNEFALSSRHKNPLVFLNGRKMLSRRLDVKQVVWNRIFFNNIRCAARQSKAKPTKAMHGDEK